MEKNKKVGEEKNKKEKSNNKIFLFLMVFLLVAVIYGYDKILWELWSIIESLFN